MFGLFKNVLTATDSDRLAAEIKKGTYLVDVRTSGEYAGGTVEGAVNIPLNEVESSLDRFEGKESIVVFCQSGNRSGQAKRILEKHGFEQVFNGGGWHRVSELVNSLR